MRTGTGNSRRLSIHSANCSFSRRTRSQILRACDTNFPGVQKT